MMKRKMYLLFTALTALVTFYVCSVISAHERRLGSLSALTLFTRETEKTMSLVVKSTERIGCPFYPKNIEDVRYMLEKESIQDLKHVADNLDRSKFITLILTNEASLPLLVNWLCMSKQSIKNITNNLLIVVPHENSSMGEILAKKGLNTVTMRFSNVCLSKMMETSRKNAVFKQCLVARFASIFLLTTWGYDVVVYDPDALIIRDPTPLYNSLISKHDAHIIAQKGTFPSDIYRHWGFTVVLGHVLYRSVPSLKLLWEKVADVQYISKDIDDQRLVNLGIFRSYAKWENVRLYNSSLGVCATGLRVAALGREYSHRGWLDVPVSSAEHLHVFHPSLGHAIDKKIALLRHAGLWNVSGDVLDGFSKDVAYRSPYQWLQSVCSTMQ